MISGEEAMMFFSGYAYMALLKISRTEKQTHICTNGITRYKSAFIQKDKTFIERVNQY
jgi:hypothetical protein